MWGSIYSPNKLTTEPQFFWVKAIWIKSRCTTFLYASLSLSARIQVTNILHVQREETEMTKPRLGLSTGSQKVYLRMQHRVHPEGQKVHVQRNRWQSMLIDRSSHYEHRLVYVVSSYKMHIYLQWQWPHMSGECTLAYLYDSHTYCIQPTRA